MCTKSKYCSMEIFFIYACVQWAKMNNIFIRIDHFEKSIYQWTNFPSFPFPSFLFISFCLTIHLGRCSASFETAYLKDHPAHCVLHFHKNSMRDFLSDVFPGILYEAAYTVIIRTKPLEEECSGFESYTHN